MALLFNSEIDFKGYYLSSVFNVSFDRCNLFRVSLNKKIYNMFCKNSGYTKIDYKVIGYFCHTKKKWTVP